MPPFFFSLSASAPRVCLVVGSDLERPQVALERLLAVRLIARFAIFFFIFSPQNLHNSKIFCTFALDFKDWV